MVEVLKKELHLDFDSAVSLIESIAQEEGFSLLATKAIDDIFKKKLGLEHYPRYTIILACSPKLAKMALDVSVDVGTLFPCSFVVYEHAGKIFLSHLSIMKTALEIGLVSESEMSPVIAETSKMIRKIWDRI